MNRRRALGAIAGAVAGGVAAGGANATERAVAGRLKQSVSYWPYGKIPLADFARECKGIGLAAVDLLQP